MGPQHRGSPPLERRDRPSVGAGTAAGDALAGGVERYHDTGRSEGRQDRYPHVPGVRSNATGGTAEIAAEVVKALALSLEKGCLSALKDGPATPEELKARFDRELGRPVLLNSVRPRLSALKARGLVKDSGQRRPGEGGRCMAIAWELCTPEEVSLFEARRAAEDEKGPGHAG